VLAYDDVLNLQRKSLYERRRRILLGDTETIIHVCDELFNDDEETRNLYAQKREELGDEAFVNAMRRVLLQTLDLLWVGHLETMDYLRSSVNLRSYGQRDPLIEYKKEAHRLYGELEYAYREQVARLLPQFSADMFGHTEQQQVREVRKDAEALGVDKGKIRVHKSNVGRNDPCPCGSGLKYKKCGMINAPEHKA